MPQVIVLAGANGAGKTTTAPALLRDMLGITEFVNADTLAQGLSAFAPEKTAVTAGKIMLRRIIELAAQRANFAFETTLASRSFAPRLNAIQDAGYQVSLFFLYLASVELALARVEARVRQGGHDVPAATVRRRYTKDLTNFFALYRPLADNWFFYDNSNVNRLALLAEGGRERAEKVYAAAWRKIRAAYEFHR